MTYSQLCPRCGLDLAGDDKDLVADAVVEHALVAHRHSLDRQACWLTSKASIPMSATNDAHRHHLMTSRVTDDQISTAISEVGYKARPLPEVFK